MNKYPNYEYKSVKMLNFEICTYMLEECLITGNFNPLIVLIIRIFSSPKNLFQSFLREVTSNSTNVEKISQNYRDDSHSQNSCKEDVKMYNSKKYNQVYDDKLKEWFCQDDPLFRKPLTIDFLELHKCLYLLFSNESVKELGLPKLVLSCLVEALIGLSLNLNFDFSCDKTFKPTTTYKSNPFSDLLSNTSTLSRQNRNIGGSYLTNYLESTNHFSNLDRDRESARRFNNSPSYSIPSKNISANRIYMIENSLHKTREYANVFIIIFSLLPIFFGRNDKTINKDTNSNHLTFTENSSENVTPKDSRDLSDDEADNIEILLLDDNKRGINCNFMERKSNYRLHSNQSNAQHDPRDSYLTFVREGLPHFCLVVAQLPICFKVRLIKIFSAIFSKRDMAIIVKCLQTMIDFKINSEFYNERKYVNDDKTVVNGVKTLEIFYYASLVAGEMSRPFKFTPILSTTTKSGDDDHMIVDLTIPKSSGVKDRGDSSRSSTTTTTSSMKDSAPTMASKSAVSSSSSSLSSTTTSSSRRTNAEDDDLIGTSSSENSAKPDLLNHFTLTTNQNNNEEDHILPSCSNNNNLATTTNNDDILTEMGLLRLYDNDLGRGENNNNDLSSNSLLRASSVPQSQSNSVTNLTTTSIPSATVSSIIPPTSSFSSARNYRRTSSSSQIPDILEPSTRPSSTATADLISLIWKDLAGPSYTRPNKLETRLSPLFNGHSAMAAATRTLLKSTTFFVNRSLERVLIIERDYLDFRFPKQSDTFAFLNHPFVLSTEFKQKALQLDNRIRMYDQRRVVYLQNLLRAFSFTPPFLKFRVRRNHLIQDSLTNLELLVEENPDYLKKQLIIEFEDETGHDQGGLSKEFFQLITEQIFNPDYGMFTYQPESHVFWFNPSSLESWSEYYLIGTIIGLAIYNGIILDTRFPLVLYTKLYDEPGTFQDLPQIHPDLYEGLKKLLEYPGNVATDMETDFKICIKDIYGHVSERELKPFGSDCRVTNENRKEYVALYADYLLNVSIDEQFSAFKRGFQLVIDDKSPLYRLFTARELELLICGNPNYDFNDFENSTTYEGGFTKDSPVIQYFWSTFHCMDENQKRALLKFATGSDRIPLGGLSNLKLVISRQGSDTDRLPTAHTCFNYLLLPEYSSEEKLKERLLLALNHSKGFGLI